MKSPHKGEATAKFNDIVVYKSRFRAMTHSFPGTESYSLFKLIVDSKTDKKFGSHLATDKCHQKASFDATIGIHPTSAEELVIMRTQLYLYKEGKKVEKSTIWIVLKEQHLARMFQRNV
jgi:glutathione reductase (NADPH)